MKISYQSKRLLFWSFGIVGSSVPFSLVASSVILGWSMPEVLCSGFASGSVSSICFLLARHLILNNYEKNQTEEEESPNLDNPPDYDPPSIHRMNYNISSLHDDQAINDLSNRIRSIEIKISNSELLNLDTPQNSSDSNHNFFSKSI